MHRPYYNSLPCVNILNIDSIQVGDSSRQHDITIPLDKLSSICILSIDVSDGLIRAFLRNK